MRRAWLVSLGLCGLLFGCVDPDDEPTDGELRPFRGEWIEMPAMPFPYLDADGVAQIRSISIGGEPVSVAGSENFVNRGDVIVEFEDRDDILVEYRPFTMARSASFAESSMEQLSVLATAGDVVAPEEIDPGDDCFDAAWKNDCQIRIVQAGQGQEERAGADLRVTLPRGYRHEIDITTTDADFDTDYHNRGNVCVRDLPGSLNVSVEQAAVFVSLTESITAAPTCSVEDQNACETWPDGTGDDPWSEGCPCRGAASPFGAVNVKSSEAADVTVDVPAGLWSRVHLTNRRPTGDASSVDAPGQRCELDVGIDAFEPETAATDIVTGAMFAPPGVTQGLGYQIVATSEACSAVTSTEDPADYAGPGTMQMIVERGNLSVCEGCLETATCSALLGI